jgi:sensory rhodopsin
MDVDTYVFAATAAVMLAATVVFLVYRPSEKGRYGLIPPAITGIAGVAYVAMAASSAGLVAVDVVTARYVDWLLATPLIAYFLTLVAGAPRRTQVLAVGADAVMIAVGYVATVSTGVVKWGAFVASSAAFAVLIYVLAVSLTRTAADLPPAARGLFQSLRDLTVFLWLGFPILWVLSPAGVGVVTETDHVYMIALLDVATKVGFEAVIAVRVAAVQSIVDANEGGTGEVVAA